MSEDLSLEGMKRKMQQLEEDFCILRCDKADIEKISRTTGIKFAPLYSDERIGMWINEKEHDNYWHEYNKRIFEPYLIESVKERQREREKRGFE